MNKLGLLTFALKKYTQLWPLRSPSIDMDYLTGYRHMSVYFIVWIMSLLVAEIVGPILCWIYRDIAAKTTT
jgi:hypothetical protein